MQSLQFLPPAKSDGPFRFREPATSHGDLHELYHEFVALPRQQEYILPPRSTWDLPTRYITNMSSGEQFITINSIISGTRSRRTPLRFIGVRKSTMGNRARNNQGQPNCDMSHP